MADQHNANVPAVGNTIAADIPDIKENLEWHKDLLQMILGWKDSTIGTVGPPNHRSKFRWKDADEIYIGPGSYFHDGTTRQTVFWDAELTFQLGSGGSNAGSDDVDAGAVAWHYIYLDDSAIVTNASPELDETCFLNTDVTAPTWSDAKHGWYNGNDRCIFAVLQSAGDAVIEFYHDGGDYVVFADKIEERAETDLDDTFTDVDCASSVPGFCTRFVVSGLLEARTTDASVIAYWRTNGQTGASGHQLVAGERIGTDQYFGYTCEVISDTSQIIEVKMSRSDADELSMNVEGWFFPTGM